ncbi:retrovirus-related Pol polyprotein from transposon gypsy [Trichonephila clavipes]|nr:retrovirus-related Pol polyprotein from transposon gypsy [Trichonephila clavipes]
MKKHKKFCRSIKAQKAFDVVKADITKVPVLKLPDFKIPFELFMDDSSIGVGAVLNQEQGPVVFTSRTLSSAERNYTVTERECLAVVSALNKFRTYLGSLPIKVFTDHAALTRLTHRKNLSSRMIRWILKLAEFNIEWKNRPGTQNVVWTFCQGTLLKCPRKIYRGDEIVKPSTSGYNLRPRRGIKVESRPNIEMRTQKEDQFEPGKAKKITTYIEEPARSSSKRTRRSSQQQNCQKRKGGVNSNRSISLEVIVGDANYKS